MSRPPSARRAEPLGGRAKAMAGLGLLGVLILSVQIAGFHDLRHDDAYITFRYGQNLASGLGLVFNPGERIMGSTSPGQMLLAAVIYRLAGQEALPAIMSALGCVAWAAQAGAVFLMLGKILGWSASLFVSLCLAAGAAESAVWVALETNAVMALTLWALALGLGSRWVGAACLCALAGLMRPDAYLVALPLGVLCFREARRAVWRPVLALAALSAPWYVFATWYFGSPIPQSAVTKFQRVGLWRYAVHVAAHVPASVLPFAADTAVLCAAWALAMAGAAFVIKRDARFWTVAAYGLLHIAAYLYLRPFVEHAWHLYPVVVVFTVFVLSAIVGGAQLARPKLPRLVLGAASLGIIAVFGFRTGALALEHPRQYWLGARDAVYRQVAGYLLQHSDPSDIVASVEVGTIAYYSRRGMHDLGGLINPPGSVLGRSGGGITVSADAVPNLRWLVAEKALFQRLKVKGPGVVFQHGDFVVHLLDLRTEAPLS